MWSQHLLRKMLEVGSDDDLRSLMDGGSYDMLVRFVWNLRYCPRSAGGTDTEASGNASRIMRRRYSTCAAGVPEFL